MEAYILYLWLGASALMIFLEFSGVPGIGMFFFGLGAASVAMLIATGMILPGAYELQLAWFFGFTALWAAILWKPLQRVLRGPKENGYSNIIGTRATVRGGPLKKGQDGQVEWSGTIMQARLAEDTEEEELQEGWIVIVQEVEGATLIVRRALLR